MQNIANFWRARSRLYQNEILQENMRLTAFFKLYKICIRLHRCNHKILAKTRIEKSTIFVKFQQLGELRGPRRGPSVRKLHFSPRERTEKKNLEKALQDFKRFESFNVFRGSVPFVHLDQEEHAAKCCRI